MSTLFSRPELLSQMLLQTMPSTTPGSAHGRIRMAMRTDRPKNRFCSTTAKTIANTVESVTPMTR